MTIDPSLSTLLNHSELHGGDPILDRDTLAALVELGGDEDPDLVVELIDLFLADAERRVEGLVAALDAQQAPEVARSAHSLKSASANLGAFSFSAACRELEGVARRGGDVASAGKRVAEMYPEVAAALTQLRIR